MSHSDISGSIILVFSSLADISSFKHECHCQDFYVDRDRLRLVGNFTEEQILLAVNKYNASVNPQAIA
jgi:hypothetical protein